MLVVAPLVPSLAGASEARSQRIIVQGRPQDTGSNYKFENIMPALDKLGGVRKMRCREPFSGTPGWNTYIRLARAGVKFYFTLAGRDIAKSISDLRSFIANVPGSISAIEFPNEPDLNPVSYKAMIDPRLGFRSGQAPALMAFVEDFAAAIRNDPLLGAIPLIASNDYMQAEQRPFSSFANSHIYPTANSKVAIRLDNFERLIAESGHKRGIITEWGRTTGGNSGNSTSPPVTVEMQASLLASDISAVLERPAIEAVSIFELFCWGGASEINNFGLFNVDLSPRPVVAAIRSVIA